MPLPEWVSNPRKVLKPGRRKPSLMAEPPRYPKSRRKSPNSVINFFQCFFSREERGIFLVICDVTTPFWI